MYMCVHVFSNQTALLSSGHRGMWVKPSINWKSGGPLLCNSGENNFGERRRSQTASEDYRRGSLLHRLGDGAAHLPAHLILVPACLPFAGTACQCQDPWMKAVGICTQIAKTGNTMGLFPVFTFPMGSEHCLPLSPAWTALDHRDTAPKPAVSGATAKLQK